MYKVIWTENNKEMNKLFEERDDAFKFQNSLFIRRSRLEDGTFTIESRGVWRV